MGHNDIQHRRLPFDFIVSEVDILIQQLKALGYDGNAIESATYDLVLKSGWTPDEFMTECQLTSLERKENTQEKKFFN